MNVNLSDHTVRGGLIQGVSPDGQALVMLDNGDQLRCLLSDLTYAHQGMVQVCATLRCGSFKRQSLLLISDFTISELGDGAVMHARMPMLIASSSLCDNGLIPYMYSISA